MTTEVATRPDVGTLEGESANLRNATKALVTTLEGRREAFERALAGRLDPDLFIQIVANAFMHSPGLQRCSQLSIYSAAMELAQIGLRPDGEEAALLPYRDKESGETNAGSVVMFQGYVRLMYRVGCRKVWSDVVRSGDEFDYWIGARPDLRHKPAPSDERGEVTHAYACAVLGNGEIVFEVMDHVELDKVRAASKAPNSSAWRDWAMQMQRKAPLRRLRKWVELDPLAAAAFRKDTSFDAGKPIPLAEFAAETETRKLAERAEGHAVRQRDELTQAVANLADEEIDPLSRTAEFGKFKGTTWTDVFADPEGYGYVKHWLLVQTEIPHPTLTDRLHKALADEVARIDAARGQAKESDGDEPKDEAIVQEAYRGVLAKATELGKHGLLELGESEKMDTARDELDLDTLIELDGLFAARLKEATQA